MPTERISAIISYLLPAHYRKLFGEKEGRVLGSAPLGSRTACGETFPSRSEGLSSATRYIACGGSSFGPETL